MAEIRRLRDSYARVRYRAAEALGKLGDPAGVEPLCEALHDPNGLVRQGAAYALGAIRDAAAVEPLCNILHDKNEYVRQAAVQALRQISDARSLPQAVLITGQLNGAQRHAALQALATVRYRGHVRLTHLYAFGDVRGFCETMLAHPETQRGAKQVLDFLAGNTLVRPTEREPAVEARNLLRPAAGSEDTFPPGLLRPADAPDRTEE